MKKLKSIFTIFLSMMILFACSPKGSVQTNDIDDNKINVVTTIFASYDFVREIAGDSANVTMLLPPGAECHSFEPTPSDIIKIQNSDVFIHIGGTSDMWAKQVIDSIDNHNIKIISLMECIPNLKEEISDDHDDHEHEELDKHENTVHNKQNEFHDDEHEQNEHHDDEHENGEHDDEANENGEHDDDANDNDEHNNDDHDIDENDNEMKNNNHDTDNSNYVVNETVLTYDEHVWTSVENAKLIVQKISEVLCETDNENSSFYQKQTTDYLKKLDDLDNKFTSIVQNAKRKTLIFADRFPFRYFTEHYGLEYEAAFSSCSVQTEASWKTIKELTDKINDEKIPAVFHIELSNEILADRIAEQTGAKKLLLHTCHNISKNDFENNASYLTLMEQNAENLKFALAF